jgi:hypothetical protein
VAKKETTVATALAEVVQVMSAQAYERGRQEENEAIASFVEKATTFISLEGLAKAIRQRITGEETPPLPPSYNTGVQSWETPGV